MFCQNYIQYNRRKTSTVLVGGIPVGSEYPIRLQSMTNTDTADIAATAAQCMKIADAGADFVRCTVQGIKEAEAMKEIKTLLLAKGYTIPLIADVHFNAKVAEVVAPHVAKVRINPGNFIDKRASFTEANLNDEAYSSELARLNEQLSRLIGICKQHDTAIRIGVNHGSLSDRIMSRYGDTPAGMVESAMEFLRICKAQDFNSIILSMKSSNTRVMVQAYRLLVSTMNDEGMYYPLHLGVTEAGEGEDGRIKSAVGIGALLADGLGDTIRVSLTEDPEKELPVAKAIVEYFANRQKHRAIQPFNPSTYNPYQSDRREVVESMGIGGTKPVAVIADLSGCNPLLSKDVEELGFTLQNGSWKGSKQTPDAIFTGLSLLSTPVEGLTVIADDADDFFHIYPEMLTDELALWLKENPHLLLAVESTNENPTADLRSFFLRLKEKNVKNPTIIRLRYSDSVEESLQLKAACDVGLLLIDGFGDGLMLSAPNVSSAASTSLAFALLQAARVRFSRTDYIACPGCGRTLFDLKTTLAKVKAATAHLSHLKIAVMGCIVNGPGEMADADYGYVGASAGKVSLYKGKELVKKNIPQENAVNELIDLIKTNGDWAEPQ